MWGYCMHLGVAGALGEMIVGETGVDRRGVARWCRHLLTRAAKGAARLVAAEAPDDAVCRDGVVDEVILACRVVVGQALAIVSEARSGLAEEPTGVLRGLAALCQNCRGVAADAAFKLDAPSFLDGVV